MTSTRTGRDSGEPEKPQTAIEKPQTAMMMLIEALTDAEHARQTMQRLLPDLHAARDSSTGQRKQLAVAAIAQAVIGVKWLDEAATRLEAAKTLHRSTVAPWITDEAAPEAEPRGAHAPLAGGRVTLAH